PRRDPFAHELIDLAHLLDAVARRSGLACWSDAVAEVTGKVSALGPSSFLGIGCPDRIVHFSLVSALRSFRAARLGLPGRADRFRFPGGRCLRCSEPRRTEQAEGSW